MSFSESSHHSSVSNNEEDEMQDLLKCKMCSAMYEYPVFLPCHNTVCSKHVFDKPSHSNFECFFCKKQHNISLNGVIYPSLKQYRLFKSLSLSVIKWLDRTGYFIPKPCRLFDCKAQNVNSKNWMIFKPLAL